VGGNRDVVFAALEIRCQAQVASGLTCDLIAIAVMRAIGAPPRKLDVGEVRIGATSECRAIRRVPKSDPQMVAAGAALRSGERAPLLGQRSAELVDELARKQVAQEGRSEGEPETSAREGRHAAIREAIEAAFREEHAAMLREADLWLLTLQ
jgi:hypothetical protein